MANGGLRMLISSVTSFQSIIIVCRPALLHFIRLKANKGMNVMSSSGVSPRNIIATSSLEELQQRAITAARESAQLLSLLSSSGMIREYLEDLAGPPHLLTSALQ